MVPLPPAQLAAQWRELMDSHVGNLMGGRACSISD
jgi:hypothetical protein